MNRFKNIDIEGVIESAVIAALIMYLLYNNGYLEWW